MKAAGSITTLIVSRGLDTLLRFCLEHLRRALSAVEGLSQRHIVVIDNASKFPYNAKASWLADVELLRFDTHQSFAAACNAGASRRPADFYLLLNNDVFLETPALARLLGVLASQPALGLCGSRLLFPDGTIQHAGVVFGAGNVGPFHRLRGQPCHLDPPRLREVQAVTGACLLVRRLVWDELGGLDESYPFGLEDIDFCLRARQRGWGIACCNDLNSLHFESLTPGRAECDVPSRRLFMQRWQGRYCLDGAGAEL